EKLCRAVDKKSFEITQSGPRCLPHRAGTNFRSPDDPINRSTDGPCLLRYSSIRGSYVAETCPGGVQDSSCINSARPTQRARAWSGVVSCKAGGWRIGIACLPARKD